MLSENIKLEPLAAVMFIVELSVVPMTPQPPPDTVPVVVLPVKTDDLPSSDIRFNIPPPALYIIPVSASLSEKVEFLIVTSPPLLYIAPPSAEAELPSKTESDIVTMPLLFSIAAPVSAL